MYLFLRKKMILVVDILAVRTYEPSITCYDFLILLVLSTYVLVVAFLKNEEPDQEPMTRN